MSEQDDAKWRAYADWAESRDADTAGPTWDWLDGWEAGVASSRKPFANETFTAEASPTKPLPKKEQG